MSEKRRNWWGLLLVLCLAVVFFQLYTGWLQPVLLAGLYALTPFLIGGIIAYLLRFLVNPLEIWLAKVWKKAKPRTLRGVAAAASYLAVFGILGGLLWLLIPNLYQNIVDFANRVPDYYQVLKKELDRLMLALNIHLTQNGTGALDSLLGKFYKNIQDNLGAYMGELGKILLASGQFLLNLGLGILISIYLLMDARRFKNLFKNLCAALLPYRKQNVYDFLREADQTMGRYINGRILECLIVGILSSVAFLIIGVKYNLMFSVIIGVTNIIPYFGPIIGAVPVLLVTLLDSPEKALWVLIVVVVVQTIDAYLLSPKILGNLLKVSPFWILLGVILGGGMFGMAGMLLGAPAMAIAAGLVQKFLAWRKAQKAMEDITDNKGVT